jgi:GT2 family glycosyltransferase
MKLSIVIVNYNVRHFLEQALSSVLKALEKVEAEVWVVDNNSVDDSVAMVKEKFPGFNLIANSQNLGFAVANNQAIRLCSGQYILLLNPDTLIEENTLRNCLAFLDAHPDAGGLGVRMVDGSGKFLPESKRGFPSPWTAFCKTFGLSTIFPKSRFFNHYHLGYLDEMQTHKVEVLSGAFMMLRKSVLEKIGLLDENFFMYGEDIDLSWRIVEAGYHNFYFPGTTIIHYKGESTKKGSLNYVRAFYQAMITFARKHFTGSKASLFVFMLQAAIWFRASLTIATNVFKFISIPVIDAGLMFAGLIHWKNFWASYYHKDPDYFDTTFELINAPLYVILWLSGIYFSGGYENKDNLRRLVRGLFLGTIFIAVLYGFLDMSYRSSRALIIIGFASALSSTVFLRLLLHFFKHGNLNIGLHTQRSVIIVGRAAEVRKVRRLLDASRAPVNYIGAVFSEDGEPPPDFLGNMNRLHEIVLIYRVEEIIFCAADVSAQEIIRLMSALGPKISYKIVPPDSLSIIGSASKDSKGELYTIDITFQINKPLERRNKRLFDMVFSMILLVTLPLHLVWMPKRLGFIRNLIHVLLGHRSWVGYARPENAAQNLPALRIGILNPLDALPLRPEDNATIHRLNLLYARNYQLEKDLEIAFKGFFQLGRP